MVGQNPAPDKILAGDMEEFLDADLIAAIGMAAERDAVILAPLGEGPIPRLLQSSMDGPVKI